MTALLIQVEDILRPITPPPPPPNKWGALNTDKCITTFCGSEENGTRRSP